MTDALARGRSLPQNALMEFDLRWNYFYELAFRRFVPTRHPVLGGYLVLVVILLADAYWMEQQFHAVDSIPFWWLFYGMLCLTLAHAFWALRRAKIRLRSYYLVYLSSFLRADQRVQFAQSIWTMGNARLQAPFSITFGAVCAIIGASQSFHTMPFSVRIHASFALFVSLTITGTGLWLAFASIAMVRRMSKSDLRMSLIRPAQTPSIRGMTAMMAYYATQFTVHVALWESAYLLLVTSQRNYLTFWNTNTLSFRIAGIVIFLFLPFLLVYFLYPQYKLRSLVVNHRDRVLLDLQRRIDREYKSFEFLGKDSGTRIDNLLGIYTEVERSSSRSLPLEGIVRFGLSFAAPLFLSVVANIDTVARILGL